LAPRTQTDGLPTALYLFILFLALTLAIVVAYRRWQSRRALEKRLAELSLLAEVGRAILGAHLDLAQLAELVYRQAGQIVDTSIFQLGLFEGDRYQLLIWIVDGLPRPVIEFRLTPDSLGIVGWMRETRRSLLVHDFEHERDSLPARPRYISDDPPRSAIFVPLTSGDSVLGAIAIQSRRPNAFSEEHLRLLTIVANHAAAALEKGRLYEQAQRRAAQLARLTEVSQQINVLQPLPDLYRQIVALAADRFGKYAVSYFECGPDRLTLSATTRPEWAGRSEPLVIKLESEAGHVSEAALSHRVVVAEELPEYVPAVASHEALLGPASAELAVPVEIDNRVLGVLDIHSRDGSPFDDIVVSIFKSLAAQMAVAILEGQTYQAERRRAEQLSALAQAARAVTSNLELDDLLDEVLELMEDRFGYDRAHIFLTHDKHLIFHAGLGRAAERSGVEDMMLALDGPGLIPLAGRTRQVVLADEVSTHPNYIPGPGVEDTRTEMAAPMVMGARLLGVLDVQSNRPGAFVESDKSILQTLADTLAVAIRNARLFTAERRRRRLAEILREVSAALAATLHLDDVLDLILVGLDRVVDYDAASILLVNEAGEVILRAIRGVPDAQDLPGMALDVRLLAPAESEPLPATLNFGEVDQNGEYHDLLGLPDPHACLAAVLALPTEHLGYLVVDRAGAEAFPPEEVELISAFAAQASVAIQNARLYTAQREQAWMSTALLQVAESTAHATELDEVLETVARLTPMLVGIDRCGVMLLEMGRFVMKAYEGLDTDGARPAQPLARYLTPEACPKLREMLETHEPVVLAPDDVMPDDLRALFPGVVIFLPLLAKDQVEGALVVGQTPGEITFTAQRIRLIGGIANQAALAIESALLYQAQQEEAWVSTALLQVAEAVAGQPLETGLETVARLTPLLIGVEKIAIYKREESGTAFRLSHLIGVERALAAQLVGQTTTTDTLSLDHAEGQPPIPFRLPEDLALAFNLDQGLAWPLRAGGDLLGLLVMEQVASLGRRLNILNGIAHQLAVALENAHLARELAQQQRLEHELEVGRDIQASFLPESCPDIPGWEVSAFWRAARQVGGDFYDFIPLRRHEGRERWGVVIADVADKGVPAALYMALSRTLLRSVAIGRVSPGATLTRVNELILSDARSDQFVTVFYGVWEPGAGHFVYANGGHNPPVLVSAEGEVHKLPGRGTALGALDHIEYQEHEIHLKPGDALLLYTDGLTDAVNQDVQDFGLERVCEVLRQAHQESAQKIVERLTEAVQAHVGAMEAFDDMTMVVMKRVLP
jgi:serine phosphatase RsbU (regulator of sigma subunit)/putative methionine-R-sulfoxide reductase with GAF domain